MLGWSTTGVKTRWQGQEPPITRGAFASPPRTLDTPTGIRSRPAPTQERHRARSARNQASERIFLPLSSAETQCVCLGLWQCSAPHRSSDGRALDLEPLDQRRPIARAHRPRTAPPRPPPPPHSPLWPRSSSRRARQCRRGEGAVSGAGGGLPANRVRLQLESPYRPQARGAQHAPPAGVLLTYNSPNARWNCFRSCSVVRTLVNASTAAFRTACTVGGSERESW